MMKTDTKKTPILELKNISKSFPGVKALTGVSLRLYPGEVLGISGENGAGKSTLIKIMGGVHQPDQGEILLSGKPVKIQDTSAGIGYGVSIIYQELSLIPELSVAENLYLGAVPKRTGGRIDFPSLYQNSAEILHMLGLELDPRRKVGSLSISVQQLVEIGKALARKARILIMDEPTSSLPKADVERLFVTMQNLKAKGYGIIFITHRLNELFSAADRIAVLRDGELIETRSAAEWDMDALVFAMVNRKIAQFYPKRAIPAGEELLSVENLGNGLIRDVSFNARRGEIIGVAGLVGSGRSELLKTLYGVYPARKGAISIKGKPYVPNSPRAALHSGIALVPENRKTEGLILDDSVKENIVLSILRKLSNHFGIHYKSIDRVADGAIGSFAIKTPSRDQKVVKLSGGNQQKVVFARCIETEPQILLLDEPTRGVDVGSKVEIYHKIMDFAEQGAAVIMVSSDLPEILGLTDRVIVMREGKMTGAFNTKGTDSKVIMDYATGGV